MSPEKTPKLAILNFTIPPDLLKRVEDFWHKQKFPNRAAAVKWLLDHALKQNPKPKGDGMN